MIAAYLNGSLFKCAPALYLLSPGCWGLWFLFKDMFLFTNICFNEVRKTGRYMIQFHDKKPYIHRKLRKQTKWQTKSFDHKTITDQLIAATSRKVIFVIHSLMNRTLLESLAFKSSTAITFEMFEIYKLTPVTYMTEIILIVTLNNQFTLHHITSWRNFERSELLKL